MVKRARREKVKLDISPIIKRKTKGEPQEAVKEV